MLTKVNVGEWEPKPLLEAVTDMVKAKRLEAEVVMDRSIERIHLVLPEREFLRLFCPEELEAKEERVSL